MREDLSKAYFGQSLAKVKIIKTKQNKTNIFLETSASTRSLKEHNFLSSNIIVLYIKN